MIFSTRSVLPIEINNDLSRSQPPPVVAVDDTIPIFHAPTENPTMLAWSLTRL